MAHAGLRRFYRLTGMRVTLRELLQELRSDRAVPAVLGDWLRTRLGPGRLELWEYLYFNVHRLKDASARDRAAFVGWRGQEVLIETLADEYSMILNMDKLTFDYFARGVGLPVPEIYAVYSARQRPGAFRKLTNARELGDFLREWRRFPIYCKPSCGGTGSRNFQIEGWADERALITGGAMVGVEDLAARLTEPTGFGFLLTEVLRPHDEIAAAAGDSISGVRLHVLRLQNGPVIFRPVWKIARRGAVADNYRHGTSGNFVASIDASTGRIDRVISGGGRHQQVDPPHPDTGRQLAGFQLPHWGAITELVREAPEFFPGFLCQGWDVAICQNGPVILEVNWFGDVDLPQLAHGRGFLDDELLDLVRERNLEAVLRGGYARFRKERYRRSWVCANGRLGRRKAHWSY